MAKKMLIDAGHPEETRVVVVSGNRIEEFDFESAARKQLKGNIYLAKVTRVEPSLQAAFVEYGGNRHGFLAFSEIHPDYYQIPVADRERLLEQEAEESRRLAEEANEADENEGPRGRRGARRSGKRTGRRRRVESGKSSAKDSNKAQGGMQLDLSDPLAFADLHLVTRSRPDDSEKTNEVDANSKPGEDDRPEAGGDGQALLRSGSHWVLNGGEDSAQAAAETEEETPEPDASGGNGDGRDEPDPSSDSDEAETTTFNELSADEEAREELERRPRVRLRDYKIQEVIKRRQIMLVQVVKEERGNKGAALTTYLSLAGRYCVLMPNTPRGGGISRKITNAADRKRLKAIAGELDVPHGMGLIIRTAGANRTKAEIRRDYEYLLRLWESVRELTLQSSAPCLVYEEGSLIKRSIRDLYSREIDNVQVEGEDGYKEAKAFMRMLMPSHAKNVQSYKDRIPLFQRYQVEQQLDAMLNPQVQLPSGGYVVLNPTEALVAIDVNSGKSTREHNIEDTALRTNMEAAEEVARQLRLRDLAGLIVIDFIDMEEPRNNRAVERKLKDCLKQDRARIQTGRISMFGLLEMSRQRLRPGMMEISTVPCEQCLGTGIVRSVESAALRILRACEEEGLRQRTQDITVPCASDVANYLLNYKRHQLTDIEYRYGLSIFIEPDIASARDSFELKRGEPLSEGRRQVLNEQAVRLESAFGQESGAAAAPDAEAGAAEEEKPKRRGRKRRKGDAEEARAETAPAEARETEEPPRSRKRKTAGAEEGGESKRRRRRGKRGGRRHRKQRGEVTPAEEQAAGKPAKEQAAAADTGGRTPEPAAPEGAGKEPAPEKEPAFQEAEAFSASADSAVQEQAEERSPALQPTGSDDPNREKAEPASDEPVAAAAELPEDERAAADPHMEDVSAQERSAKEEREAEEKAGAERDPQRAEETGAMAVEAGKSNGNGSGHGEPADETGTGPDEQPGNDESEAAARLSKQKKPARRGWWQRRGV